MFSELWSFRFSKRSINQNVEESLVCDGGRPFLKEHTSLNGLRKQKHELEWGEGRPEGVLLKLAPSSFYLEHNQHVQ